MSNLSAILSAVAAAAKVEAAPAAADDEIRMTN
jgi:hypothetical protein